MPRSIPISTAVIPRFLLPRQGSLWLQPANVRNVTNSAPKATPKPKGPIVLEKPAKFNPPSHPQRRAKPAPRYPGPNLSAEETARMATKKYPNMMPAEGTWAHWFINNRTVHMYITLSTLLGLAGFVWFSNFRRNSPYTHLLPDGKNCFLHPFSSIGTFFEVVKLTSDYNTIQVMERRKAKVEDVRKRHEYRKAHGFDMDEGFGGWTAKSDAQTLGPGILLGDGTAGEGATSTEGGGEENKQVARQPRPPVKKWLGIW
ncbi:hypothetical protein HYFRA_00010510 [Hymenoscyphus fraxineus]|uniref:Uncharacterized protein n=1 Tax=Hymenoscyphus fraxineus TaxID=746836 RepID=A0A9N9L3U3_9HELO|nr:hypothetical protein HYFRA_00010510 [Hymenoscyphus fraxineus]